MNKRTLLLLGAKVTGALALFGAGIGAYVLFSPSEKNTEIKYWTYKENDSNIVKSNAITSSWTSVTHYPESKFFITCTKGSGSDKGGTVGDAEVTASCKKYIESKVSGGQPIWVKQQQSDLGTSSLKWDTYKFTYKEGVEGDNKDYFGFCFPNPDVLPDSINNPCSTQNLPKGWTRSLVTINTQRSS